ncbi:MAG TPA: hypothetical protein PLS87_04305 [Ferruginibacter sp.]|nr:hypothetical protein [Ferruginibacter sp.]HRO97583.1 hypothetical protein [Ferruginibacter sp.]HRP50612.1 hypothetical protein [Ferruginibacter sp.]
MLSRQTGDEQHFFRGAVGFLPYIGSGSGHPLQVRPRATRNHPHRALHYCPAALRLPNISNPGKVSMEVLSTVDDETFTQIPLWFRRRFMYANGEDYNGTGNVQ